MGFRRFCRFFYLFFPLEGDFTMSKLKKSIFEGAATAIVTPFRDNEVDYETFGELIEFQINGGIDALVVAGTTGEGSTLTHEEHCGVISYAVEKVNGRVPVIAGTGSNDTAYGIELSKLRSFNSVLTVGLRSKRERVTKFI